MARMHAIVALVAACSSSSPKPAEESSPPTPTRTEAGSGSAATTSGSQASPGTSAAADPWSKNTPADPATDLALLRADVDIICGAAKVTGGTTVIEVGPYIAEHMKTYHKVGLFADIRSTTLDELIERIRQLMAKADVQKCDTVDVLIANDPRKKH